MSLKLNLQYSLPGFLDRVWNVCGIVKDFGAFLPSGSSRDFTFPLRLLSSVTNIPNILKLGQFYSWSLNLSFIVSIHKICHYFDWENKLIISCDELHLTRRTKNFEHACILSFNLVAEDLIFVASVNSVFWLLFTLLFYCPRDIQGLQKTQVKCRTQKNK